MQSDVLDPELSIPDESRIEANEILRDYAELARAEIQALHNAGTLDQEAMARIKRDTKLQAANELRSHLPADEFEAMFLMEVEPMGE